MLSQHAHRPWFNYFLLFFGVLCIAWSAIFVKLAGISGFGSAFYRMAFGLIAIFPLWLRFRKPVTDRRGVKIALLCGLFFACDIALWNTSIMLTKASISTLLGNMAPVWVGFGAVFVLKERPGRIFWTGTAIALVGVAIVVGLDKLSATDFSFGNFLSIAASMFYGAYLLTTRKGRNTLDTFSFTLFSMAASTLALGLLCLFTRVPLWGFSAPTWWSLVALGVVPQMLGWLAINFALAYIKPTVASVTLLSQSILTAIFSIPVLGEFMSVREIVGALIALTGIYLVNTKR
jgi:drug/metabolite transporter (DMT)-like permease